MKVKHGMTIVVLLAVAAVAAAAVAGGTKTLIATVTDDYLLVDDDGEIYIVAETEKGDELLENVGFRVKVTGNVQEGDNGPVIDVQSFEIIPE